MLESKQILEIAVKGADDKRAEDIIAMDVSKVSLLADYFLICHGNSDKQVMAIADSIIEAAHKANVEIKRVEGRENGKWVLIDLSEVIVHVFYHEEREFYNLEKLWKDAPLVDVSSMVE
ncbi:ribosome silencing factor [Vagococcus silagei]|uniref:Ribosomal silencing factor RsfS n=1 Tax=Vagococcus silagei TaxID=2508885 RepID=A0A4S3B4R6_9ENTE|nr:ribosome silencing factor [Vagococcus silagei]THB62061.1 ribosome silencing factor [Vagococcus silagei]